jgi:phage shock protein PspC (stress-responsive transcriptional regulator)
VTTENRRLRLSREDPVVAGVCDGLGKHQSIDPRLSHRMYPLTAEVAAPVCLLRRVCLDEAPAG